jgi:hypothetical protein
MQEDNDVAMDKAMSFDEILGDEAEMDLVAECPKCIEERTDWVQ